MKIFVLDDCPERIAWFCRIWSPENVTYTDSPTKARDILVENEFDAIFLDHDLGGGPYKRGKDGDGIDLAKMMSDEQICTDTTIIIHSLNFSGAQNIFNTLSRTHKYVHICNFVRLRYHLGPTLESDGVDNVFDISLED